MDDSIVKHTNFARNQRTIPTIYGKYVVEKDCESYNMYSWFQEMKEKRKFLNAFHKPNMENENVSYIIRRSGKS